MSETRVAILGADGKLLPLALDSKSMFTTSSGNAVVKNNNPSKGSQVIRGAVSEDFAKISHEIKENSLQIKHLQKQMRMQEEMLNKLNTKLQNIDAHLLTIASNSKDKTLEE